MGTINYSGELLCRLWDNKEVDFRGVLGACEWFTHHLTCMGNQNSNSNDGGALWAKVDFSYIKYMGAIYVWIYGSVGQGVPRRLHELCSSHNTTE